MGDRLSIERDSIPPEMRAEPVIRVIDRMAATSAHLMEEASVWNAVLTLAKALPVAGRMAGSDTLSFIGSVTPRLELDDRFQETHRIGPHPKFFVSRCVAAPSSWSDLDWHKIRTMEAPD
jgi:hypothetical protein